MNVRSDAFTRTAMEVVMPYSSIKDTIITAGVCTILVMHSTFALSAEAQNSSWSNLFGCANKDTMRTIGETSFGALSVMNTTTAERAQSWADTILGEGTALSRKAGPYLFKGAKSPTTRAVAGIATASSFGLWVYNYYACPK
jgi:hypothetical protein